MTESAPKESPGLSALRLDKRDFGSARRRRRWVVPFLFLLTAVVVVSWLAYGRRAAGPEVETLTVPPPARPEGDVQLTATGYVVARRKAAVGAKIPGRLAWLGVEEGSRVKRGDVIARLEAADLEANVAQAAARVKGTEADLVEAEATQVSLDLEEKRLKVLFEQGLGTRQDADRAAAAASAGRARIASLGERVRADRAQVDYAEAVRNNAVIVAPFDGVVLTKDAEVGESVAPAVGGGGTTRGSMVTMADMESLEVEADVGEASIAQLRVGQPAEIVLDAFPDRPYRAVLHQIVPTADRQKATVQVKVRFTAGMEGALPEMSAKVNFLASQAAEGSARVITVPESSLRKSASGWAVVRLEGGVARESPVTLAADPASGKGEVLTGLSGGEEIVLSPPETLKAGMKVRIKQATRR